MLSEKINSRSITTKTFIQKGNPSPYPMVLYNYQPQDTNYESFSTWRYVIPYYCYRVVKITGIKAKRHVKTWRFRMIPEL
ncbi:hypothetical protein FDX05_07590 [Citrobacter sp. wls715]|nr:hypothetical protein FDX05_07590 [Citrobacter sp. wls715]